MIESRYYGEYNCGGFALGTYKWERPFPTSWETQKYFPFRFEKGIYILANSLRERFPVRIVTSFHYISSNEYPVLFRVGARDFHFMRYNSLMDNWIHKMGNSSYIEVYNNPFKETWLHRYDSQLIRLAVKKQSYFNEDEELIKEILLDNHGNLDNLFKGYLFVIKVFVILFNLFLN